MSILPWIEDQKRLKLLNAINAPKYDHPASDSSKGLWTRCDKCGVILYIKHLKENQRVCFGCTYHLQMSSEERIENILDKNTWRPFDESVSPCDPLEFKDEKEYTDRLEISQERTGLQDAIQTGSGMVDGIPVALGVMDFAFMGGSMGSVVGEKVTRLIEYATQEGLTLILICASGGARMQEGVFSLMQMAKISSALQVYQTCANLLYISIITSPTTGGVTASFGMLGDIILAEPRALIGFAGRRVIEQTLCEDLPDDFQTSEYMLHHGLVDLIVPRRFLRQALSETIRLYKNAPFKQPGKIPFGVQNPISFIGEEKLRRRWGKVSSPLAQSKSNTNSLHLSTLKQTSAELLPLQKSKKETESLAREAYFYSEVDGTSSQHSGNKLKSPYKTESIEYREILTSFQTMFYLFSKQIATRYQSDTDSIQASQYDIEALGNGTTTAYPKPELSIRDQVQRNHPLPEQSSGYLNAVQVPEPELRSGKAEDEQVFVNTNRSSSNTNSLEIEEDLTRINSGNEAYSLKIKDRNNEPIKKRDHKREQDGNKHSLLTMFRNLSENMQLNDQDTDLEDTRMEFISASKTSRAEEYLNDIDFLNQAIELAATESIEWRAFYVHQKVSNRTSFLEDFVESNCKEKNENVEDINLYRNTLQNTLFYRSICKASLQIDEELV